MGSGGYGGLTLPTARIVEFMFMDLCFDTAML